VLPYNGGPRTHACNIIQMLIEEGGQAGRALRNVSLSPLPYRAATSDCPIDISDDYMHHSHRFRELGLLTVVNVTEAPRYRIEAIPHSTARRLLLQEQRQGEDI